MTSYIQEIISLGYATLNRIESWYSDYVNSNLTENDAKKISKKFKTHHKNMFVLRSVRANIHNLYSVFDSYLITHVHSASNLIRASFDNLIQIQYFIDVDYETFDLFWSYVNSQNEFQPLDESFVLRQQLNYSISKDEKRKIYKDKMFRPFTLRQKVYSKDQLKWIKAIYKRFNLSTHYLWFEYDGLYVREPREALLHAKSGLSLILNLLFCYVSFNIQRIEDAFSDEELQMIAKLLSKFALVLGTNSDLLGAGRLMIDKFYYNQLW